MAPKLASFADPACTSLGPFKLFCITYDCALSRAPVHPVSSSAGVLVVQWLSCIHHAVAVTFGLMV
jgi:hypothetical protein